MPLMVKMATPTSISVKVQARVRKDRDLINIILEPVAGDISNEASSAVDRACLPVQRNGDLTHIRGVSGGSADAPACGIGERSDIQSSAIPDALLAGGGLGVVDVNKIRWDEAVGIDLVPVVKSQGLDLLEHDLSSALILTGHLHDKKSVRQRGNHPQRHHRDNGGRHHDVDQSNTALGPAAGVQR